MSKDKRGHVGRCHQLEAKPLEFDQSTRMYLLDSWALRDTKECMLIWGMIMMRTRQMARTGAVMLKEMTRGKRRQK